MCKERKINSLKKLKKAAGAEWLLVFATITILFVFCVGVNYYFVLNSMARKLANNIGNILIEDMAYTKRCSNINSLVELKQLIEEIDNLKQEYGEAYRFYLQEAGSYVAGRTLIDTSGAAIIGTSLGEIKLLLSDNYLYTYKEGLLEPLNKKIMYYEDVEQFWAVPNVSNINFLNKNFYFLPILGAVLDNLNNDFRYKGEFKNFVNIDEPKPYKEPIKNLAENITDTENRKVIDIVKTKELIDALIAHYNRQFEGKVQFEILWSDANKGSIDEKTPINMLKKDANEIDFIADDSVNAKQEFMKKVKNNRFSFFFYSYMDGKKRENYAYRIRPHSFIDCMKSDTLKTKYLAFDYPNSVHLVIIVRRVNIPFFKGYFEVKQYFDIILKI